MRWVAALASILVLAAVTGASAATPIDFTVDAGASGLDGTQTVGVETSGTLIGNWDPVDNPTGTRTKPGIFGAFGDTENLPVDVTLSGQIGGPLQTAPTGTFRLMLDPAAGTVELTDLALDLLGGVPLQRPATVTFQTPAFRTRNPSSTYPGGVPITLPIGSVTLGLLTATQVGGPSLGTLTETGPGTYDFAVAAAVTYTLAADFLGTPLAPPPVPGVFVLGGQVVITGATARLTSVRPIELAGTQNPGFALPEFPLALPTVLPPGGTANVLMNLTLDEVGFALDATATIAADGVVGPPPLTGDMNCDGVVDFDDIDPFVLALAGPVAYGAQYPDCRWLNADCDGNGAVNFADIDAFVALFGM